MEKLTKTELKFVFLILKALKENQLIYPAEDWELDHYGERLINRRNIGKTLLKIEQLLTENERKEIEQKILLRKYSAFGNELNEDAYSAIERAFARRNTAEIEYFSLERGEPTKRKIDVYYKSRRYVIAFCHLRNAIRKFRASRIMNAKITNEKYAIPENFDKDEFL